MIEMNLSSKRNFYLRLSPPDGQNIAVAAGLIPADADVSFREEKDVVRRWTALNNQGVLQSLAEAADWMSDIMVNDEIDDEDLDSIITVQEGEGNDGAKRFVMGPASEEDLANLKETLKSLKDSAYNTVLGCMVSTVSKLIDESKISVNATGAEDNE